MVRIAINGLGRIGRAVLKIAMDSQDIRIIAVNDLLPVDNLAYLLKFDTVYGRYLKSIDGQGNRLKIDDDEILFYSTKDPAELPWKDLNIDVALECTGHFASTTGLEKHLNAGAKYAILSAPSKNDGMKFIVPGVNHAEKSDRLLSLASCTTNCIAPVIEIVHRRFGVKKAVMSTVHAYTSTQSIVDGPAKKFRRGRAAAMNLVPTTTGAAEATTKVITELEGLFDGIAIRVPVPVGSISDIVSVVSKRTSVDEVNNVFREESQTNRYRDIIGVSDEEIVSSDIIQDPRASIIDLTMTKVVDGDLIKIMSWYDNEWGYAAQMVRETSRIGKLIS